MPLWAFGLLFMVVSQVISGFLVKKSQQQPAGMEEFDFPQEEEGTPQAVFFGDCWTKGYQTIWHGNIRTIKIKSGGKK